MSIDTKILGFYGIESYDILLSVAKLLFHLDNQILIMDNSGSGALSGCIPIPESLNPKETMIEFNRMDFAKDYSFDKESEEYNYILIDFGFQANRLELAECDWLIIVTDKQLHNIARIRNMRNLNKDAFLVIKDVLRADDFGFLMENFKEYKVSIKKHYVLYLDDMDKENMLFMQYNNQISFKRISIQFKVFLFQIMTDIFEYSKSDIQKAYKQGKRGD